MILGFREWLEHQPVLDERFFTSGGEALALFDKLDREGVPARLFFTQAVRPLLGVKFGRYLTRRKPFNKGAAPHKRSEAERVAGVYDAKFAPLFVRQAS